MSARRVIPMVLVTAAITLLTAGLSRLPWRMAGGDAVIRLSWSGRPERLEVCRRLSDAELAERPAHMRQAVVCEGTTASYRFEVALDGTTVAEGLLRGGGFRNDRPIYLLRDLEVPPGEHDLRVTLARVESARPDSTDQAADSAGLTLDRDVREAEERQRRRLEALPAALRLEERVVLAPRQVLLVTYDPDARRLALRTAAATAR
ncbi:MAG TPA: hypothetical protein VLL51_08160 [Gemmatimonadales bacterium]|nr:hypothetical protein [Gemmatimonadales bacterium]